MLDREEIAYTITDVAGRTVRAERLGNLAAGAQRIEVDGSTMDAGVYFFTLTSGTTAVNGQLKIAWPAKVLAGDIAPGFTIDLAHKDLSLIMGAAHAAKVPMPMGAAAHEAYSSARARGHGANDFSSMLDAHCELAALKAPRLKKS